MARGTNSHDDSGNGDDQATSYSETEASSPVVFLSRADILNIDDTKYSTVHVPEWRTHVMLRGLTAGERDRYESGIVTGTGKNARITGSDIRTRLLQMTIVDPNTKRPMFSRADVESLSQKSAAAMERLFDEARKLSGMTEDDVKELEGNF